MPALDAGTLGGGNFRQLHTIFANARVLTWKHVCLEVACFIGGVPVEEDEVTWAVSKSVWEN